jgi:hypothetical protein
VRFLAAIVERLSAEHHLPFFAVAAGLDLCVEYALDPRPERALRPLYYALQDAERTALAALEETHALLMQLPQQALPTTFTFDQRPKISVEAWLAALQRDVHPSDSAVRFVEWRTGSHVELFLLAPAMLGSLLVTLSLVERIIDKLVHIRARAGLLTAKSLPPEIRRRALQPPAGSSAALVRDLRACLAALSGPGGDHLIAGAHAVAESLRGVEIET